MTRTYRAANCARQSEETMCGLFEWMPMDETVVEEVGEGGE